MLHDLGQCWLFCAASQIWKKRTCFLDDSDHFNFCRLLFYNPDENIEFCLHGFSKCCFIYDVSTLERCNINGNFDDFSTHKPGIRESGEMCLCNPYFVCLNCPCCSDNTGKSFEIAVKDIESQLAWMSLISSHVSSGKHIVKALRKIFTDRSEEFYFSGASRL